MHGEAAPSCPATMGLQRPYLWFIVQNGWAPYCPPAPNPPLPSPLSLPPQVRPEEVELIRRDYTANGGWETFLEYGDPRQVRAVESWRLLWHWHVQPVHRCHSASLSLCLTP